MNGPYCATDHTRMLLSMPFKPKTPNSLKILKTLLLNPKKRIEDSSLPPNNRNRITFRFRSLFFFYQSDHNMSETAPEVEFLRGCELRLLRCTLPPPPFNFPPQSQPSDQNLPSHHLRSLINDLLVCIEAGKYLQAMTSSDAERLVFKLTDFDSFHPLDDSPECADRVYSEVMVQIESFLSEECQGEDANHKAYRVVLVLCIAVAAFLAFTQYNMTG